MTARKCGFLWLAVLLFWGCGNRDAEKAAPERPRTPAASAVESPDDRPVIVALGDSLTAGLGVDLSKSYPAQLQSRLDAAGFRYRVVNAGVSGDTSAQGLNRLSAILALRPAIVIVALGANDGLRGIRVTETGKNLDEIIRRTRAAGARVLLAGMEMPPNYGPDYTREFRAVFAELARTHELAFLPFLLDGVGGVASLNQPDGIHPTAEGYSRVVENLWPVLMPLLSRR